MQKNPGQCCWSSSKFAVSLFASVAMIASGLPVASSVSARPLAPFGPRQEGTRHKASCDRLMNLNLAATTMTSATAIAANSFIPPNRGDQQAVPVAFCRVTGTIRPSADSEIKFEVWLPQSGWTGRYESVGNGGFAGAIRYDSMWNPLLGGSAVASTDDGHSAPAVGLGSAKWAMGHPEKITDYGHRAVHLTAQAGKAITNAYFGRKPKYSYFVGCSKGGQEAFMEAQRYPDDFDGIVAGAAANQWVNLFSSFPWTAQLNLESQTGYIGRPELELIAGAVQRDCDAADGVKDGLISDPQRCHVNLKTAGLTNQQIATFVKIHDGPKSRTGAEIYAGHPYGTELVELPQTISGLTFATAPSEIDMGMYGNEFFRYFVYQNPEWTFSKFQIDQARSDAQKAVGRVMNSDGLNFARFRARGGKLIQWNGLADGIVTPLGAVSYYRRVVTAQGKSRTGALVSSTRALADTKRFHRLFLAPGVGHCSGGPGPNVFGQAGGNRDPQHDMVSAVQRWVEKGIPPQRIIATKYVNDDPTKGVFMTRPLCPYPEVAEYKKAGQINRADNFVCAPRPM